MRRSWLLAVPLPPPPPPVRSSKSKAFVGFGLVVLLVDVILLGLLLWERFTTTYWFSGYAKGDEIRITETIFFERQLRVEASHEFTAGHSATVCVAIENGSGLVWQRRFSLSSPGTQKETKYESDYLTLMPGKYIVKVNSSVPTAITGSSGSTEVVVERSGFLTVPGRIFMIFLFPISVVSGFVALTYSRKPQDLIQAIRRKVFADWKSALKGLAILAAVWIGSMLLITAIVGLFRNILYLLGMIIFICAIGLLIQAIKKASSSIRNRLPI